jgi:hypothetical protein
MSLVTCHSSRTSAPRERKTQIEETMFCARRPENIGFWRGLCCATVSPDARGAIRQFHQKVARRGGGKLRFTEAVIGNGPASTPRRHCGHDLEGSYSLGWRMKARKAPKAPKIAAKTATAERAVGKSGSFWHLVSDFTKIDSWGKTQRFCHGRLAREA